MNIIEAASDPHIFRQVFRNRESWAAWFAFLATLFALSLSADELVTFQQCTGLATPPKKPLHEAWVIVGRRGGKSFVLALIAVFLAGFHDWAPNLAPGERGTIMVIAADRRQARTILRYIKGLLAMVPMLSQLIEAERAESIDLFNRLTIEVHTASFRSVRGYTVVAALCDEMAFWATDESAAADSEVITALKPAMATIPGAMLLCASTPYARKGVLWENYHRYYGQEGPRLIWQAPTRTHEPHGAAGLHRRQVRGRPGISRGRVRSQLQNRH